MDDIKLAMLGDREAAKRLTDAGVLVPCPMCRSDKIRFMRNLSDREFGGYKCSRCGLQQERIYQVMYEARLAWNTRAPILSAEELEMLEGME